MFDLNIEYSFMYEGEFFIKINGRDAESLEPPRVLLLYNNPLKL